MITSYAVTGQIADQRRADRLREAHLARRARAARRQHNTTRGDSKPGGRLRGAARIATAT